MATTGHLVISEFGDLDPALAAGAKEYAFDIINFIVSHSYCKASTNTSSKAATGDDANALEVVDFDIEEFCNNPSGLDSVRT
eukprot:4284726-Pyramimonas_sp.AAC.1